MLTVKDVQDYSKDKVELNHLLEGNLQSEPALIELAMRLTVNSFNITEPITDFDLKTFPSEEILLYGTLHHICNSEAERQLRNFVQYSAQGLNAGIDNNHELYNRLAVYYKQLFDSKVQAYKRFINTQAAWGGEYSPYAVINEYKTR